MIDTLNNCKVIDWFPIVMLFCFAYCIYITEQEHYEEAAWEPVNN